MGWFSSKVTVGYWFNLALNFGLGRCVDSIVQIRGGDDIAWTGDVSTNQTVRIDAPDLWGGTDSEGGLDGEITFMFGAADQIPNAESALTFGPEPAYRGRTMAYWRGKYGAFSPYPKPMDFLVRSIFADWADGAAWYPEAAEVGEFVDETQVVATDFTPAGALLPVGYLQPGPYLDVDVNGFPVAYTGNSRGTSLVPEPTVFTMTRFGNDLSVAEVTEYSNVGQAIGSNTAAVVAASPDGNWQVLNDGSYGNAWLANRFKIGWFMVPYEDFPASWWYAEGWSNPAFGGLLWWIPLPDFTGQINYGLIFGNRRSSSASSRRYLLSRYIVVSNNLTAVKTILPLTEEQMAVATVGFWVFVDAANVVWTMTQFGDFISRDYTLDNVLSQHLLPQGVLDFLADTPTGIVAFSYFRGVLAVLYKPGTIKLYQISGGNHFATVTLPGAPNAEAPHRIMVRSTGYYVQAGNRFYYFAHPAGSFSVIAMNPAHMIYKRMRKNGEPLSTINDASFRAAADVFKAEGMGLCTSYDPSSESHDDFVARVCAVAGCNLTRSRVNGQWYLDPVREITDIAGLPVLTDANIIEWSETPSVIDDAVNQIIVEWTDVVNKETRQTAPVQSLGAIQAVGSVNADTNKYPEVPFESLALRLGQRDVNNKSTPLRAFDLTTDRTPYAWRKGSRFLLQVPLRGIASMVCMVADTDGGTLRNGAIALKVSQDIYGMPSTSYVKPVPVEAAPDNTGRPAPSQQLVELTYRDQALLLQPSQLSSLSDASSFTALLAQRPTSGLNFTLMTAGPGQEYSDRGPGDWSPTALTGAVASVTSTVVPFVNGSDLDQVVAGMVVRWEAEICRVDAIDAVEGTVTLARGCADTVPVQHAVGTRLWFCDDSPASDGMEYLAGDTVRAKALTRAPGNRLSIDSAPLATALMTGRAAHPYPPAAISINGEFAPVSITEDITLAWSTRNRLSQGASLVDWFAASVDPEAGTSYRVQVLRVSDGSVLLDSGAGAVSPVIFPAPVVYFAGQVVMRATATRDGLECIQPVERAFYYSTALVDVFMTEDGAEPFTTEDGAEPFTTEPT